MLLKCCTSYFVGRVSLGENHSPRISSSTQVCPLIDLNEEKTPSQAPLRHLLINNVINVIQHLQIVTMNENYSFCDAQAFKEFLMFYNFSYLRVEPRTQAAQHPPTSCSIIVLFLFQRWPILPRASIQVSSHTFPVLTQKHCKSKCCAVTVTDLMHIHPHCALSE